MSMGTRSVLIGALRLEEDTMPGRRGEGWHL